MKNNLLVTIFSLNVVKIENQCIYIFNFLKIIEDKLLSKKWEEFHMGELQLVALPEEGPLVPWKKKKKKKKTDSCRLFCNSASLKIQNFLSTEFRLFFAYSTFQFYA